MKLQQPLLILAGVDELHQDELLHVFVENVFQSPTPLLPQPRPEFLQHEEKKGEDELIPVMCPRMTSLCDSVTAHFTGRATDRAHPLPETGKCGWIGEQAYIGLEMCLTNGDYGTWQ